jgi:hypothetical protein
MLKDLLGLVGSAASGGIFGVVGAIGGSVMKYFNQKQEQKFKKDEWQHEKDMILVQMDVESQKGSWAGLIESYKSDKPLDTYKWVNAIKALYRPLLTSSLVVITYLLFKNILYGLNGDHILSEIFTGSELKEILRYIVYSIVFSTATAISWWFCERALSPPGLKNR